MKTNKLKLIGMSKGIHSIAIELYFSNGERKEVYESDFRFKTNEKVKEPYVVICGYKDKTEWNGVEHTVIGKDETSIESCYLVANRAICEDYMYKLGIFNENVEVNRGLIEANLQTNFESTVSHLASSISSLEHTLGELNKKEA